MQRDKVKEALRKHDSNYLYEQVNTEGKENEVIGVVIEEFLKAKLEELDDEAADNILVSAVHSSIAASDLGLAIYNAGRASV